MTQELIATCSGYAARGHGSGGRAAERRLIHYSRAASPPCSTGPLLEAAACECYRVVKTQFDRLLPYAIA